MLDDTDVQFYGMFFFRWKSAHASLQVYTYTISIYTIYMGFNYIWNDDPFLIAGLFRIGSHDEPLFISSTFQHYNLG